MIFLRPRSVLGAPSKLWPWIVFMESRRGGLVIPEIRVGEEAMRRLWLVEVGVEGVVVPVPVLDSEVLTAGAREASPNPGRQRKAGVNAHPAALSHSPTAVSEHPYRQQGPKTGTPQCLKPLLCCWGPPLPVWVPVTVLVAGRACRATSGWGTACGCRPGTCCSLGRDMMDWLLSAGEGGTRRGCWEATEVGGRCGGRIFSAISCSLILLIRTRLSSCQGNKAGRR